MSSSPSTPIIYLITPGDARGQTFDTDERQIIEAIKRAIDLGVTHIQIREKNLSSRNLFSLTRTAVAACRASGAKIVVNDRADVAKAADADGVHLTARSLAPSVIRSVFGREFLIAVSTHTSAEITAASESADFAVYGPVFDTPGKNEAKGIEELRRVCAAAHGFPVLGLGGIDAANARQVLDAGAAGIAGIRSLNDPHSLAKIIEEIKP